jgi:gamma-glutamyltranspeptidase/glutathione hydrolase
MAHLVNQRGDTVHVDVVDRWGNMVSATPSGGWLKSNPVVPGWAFRWARGRRCSGSTRGCPRR